MNVLLTCAGRRNYLVNYFKQALGGRGQVFAADSSAIAPAMMEADRTFVVPPVNDAMYFDVLFEIAEANAVSLLISLNDLELPYLSHEKARFLDAGIIPVVSDPRVIDICFDKRRTIEFLSSINMSVPKTCFTMEDANTALQRGDLAFPLVVKPRWGTASIGLEFVKDEYELPLAYKLLRHRLSRTILAEISVTDQDHCVMIQELLDGQEYGLDVVNDLDGRYVSTFVKKKLAMRAGETDKAITVASEKLVSLGANIGEALGHVGNLDCDVFITANGCYFLEMNPRFGGGYPFSHEAGANIPAALIAWAEGKIPDPSWFKLTPGITSVKCDRLVTVKL